MPKTTPAPVPVAAEQTTTVSGYAINILAFIPVDKKDLARQIEIPTILQAVMTGEKDITALAPYLYGTEVRNNYINKRYPLAEARAMMTPVAKAEARTEPTTRKPGLEGDDRDGGDAE